MSTTQQDLPLQVIWYSSRLFPQYKEQHSHREMTWLTLDIKEWLSSLEASIPSYDQGTKTIAHLQKMKNTTLILRGLTLLLCAVVTKIASAPLPSHLPRDWNELASNTSTIAAETLTSAYILSKYVKSTLLSRQEPPPTEPCFLEERDGREYLNGQLDPGVQYAERLVADHGSVADYLGYLGLVESESHLVSRTPHFQDLQSNMNRLQSSLESLLCSLVEGGHLNATGITFCLMSGTNSTSVMPDKDNATASNGTEEGHGSQLEESDGVLGEEEDDIVGAGIGPEHCQDTRYEYQYSMYLRVISLATYITTDIRGFRESLPTN